MPIKFRQTYLESYISDADYENIQPALTAAHNILHNRNGAGNDFLGWLDLPEQMNEHIITKINATAERVRAMCDLFIVVGIGGSYLGARAGIEFIHGANYNRKTKSTPEIYFAGSDMCPESLSDLLDYAQSREVCLCIISKSGTTTEPALAARLFRKLLQDKYGKDAAAKRTIAITDPTEGKLRQLATAEGYETYTIPPNVGGRFSVLSAVGLLPLAVAGVDIAAVMNGARASKKQFTSPDVDSNDCYRYVAARNILHGFGSSKGKSIEVLAYYSPSLTMFAEWFKQLFGESEGKNGRGIFPASVCFTTDLHSLGQYIQDGPRIMFETVLDIVKAERDIVVPHDDSDGLDFLTGKNVHDINRIAMEATAHAHANVGNVPNIMLEIDRRDAFNFGELVYFFELACGVSGYMLGVNPFDQPGVEAYKKEMFKRLGK